jgi:LuxR family transcriptional regulator, maltose regulon positive regulatory protein
MSGSPGAMEARSASQGRIIPRGRLATTLGDALESGGLIVTAGGGCGKTTVLDQAVSASGRPVAWIGCSEVERAAGALLMRLVGALAEAAPGATDAIAERLAVGIERVDVLAATRDLLAELSKLLVEPVVVVIDDAEFLDGADESVRLVGELMRAEPPSLHVAVASRRPLDLKVAKPRAAGRLAELTAADLAFDPEECNELLRLSLGADPSPEQVEAVMKATEGWPLGIALAAGLIGREDHSADGIAALSDLAAAPDLQAYLSEELLDSLEHQLREAAIDSSIARVITPGIAAALDLGDDFGLRVERAGLLVRHLDQPQAWAYHPLLREFLLERLAIERDEDERRRLHAAIAPVVAEEGDPISGIEHWLDAGSWERAMAAIEAQGLALSRTSPELVRSWLARLPPEVSGLPTMRAVQGQLEWGAGDHPRAAVTLRDAIKGFRERPNPPLEWLARFVLADALFNLGEFEEAEGLVDGWDEDWAEAAGLLAPATVIYVGICLASIGRFEDSDRLAAAALRHPQARLLGPVEVIRFAFHEWPKGNLDPPYQRALEVAAELERFDPLNRRLYVLATLGIMNVDRGQFGMALKMWMRVREGASTGGAPFLADASLAIAALLHAMQGRLREAELELTQYRGLEKGWRSYVGHESAGAVAALRGDAEKAIEEADLAMESAESAPILFYFWAAVDAVGMHAVAGNLAGAWEVLEGATSRVDEVLPGEVGRYPRCRLIAMSAWLHELAGNDAAADRTVHEFWREADGCRRFAVRVEWPRIQPIVWRALERELLDPEPTVAAVSEAFPEGVQLVPFLEHPVGAVRRAALDPAIRSGSPEALEVMAGLEKDSDPEMAQAAAAARARLAVSLPPLRFSVLGGFRVARGAWRTGEEGWGRPADARLVRFLLANLDQPLAEDRIFEALWPELSVESARRSLQVSVSRVRKRLDPPGSGSGDSLIQSSNRNYRLALGRRDTVDAEEFSYTATTALAERGEGRRSLLQHARSLWAGEPLPEDRYADWATAYRERLADQHVAVLTALVELHQQAGEHADAAAAARELVDLDPLNEEGHRALMTAYARTGRRGQALRQYLECRRAMVDTLGVEPAEATSRLQARILAGEAV